MARQEAQSKLLYYPTSNQVIDLLATWLSNPSHSRLADPCVGEGEALARLKKALGGDCETWGVEVSYSRVQKAQRVIDVVLPASFYHVRWLEHTVSLSVTNPPYDFSDYTDERGRHIRHERLFATQMTRRLAAGGIHLIIVPRMMLLDEELARHITSWYERVLVFGYPNTRFDQVVVIAVKRLQYQHPTKTQIEGLTAWGNADVALTELCPGDGRYIIPPAPAVPTDAFVYTPMTHEEQVRAARQCSPLKTDEWARAVFVRPVGAPIHPCLQENIGHTSMELSSGGVGVLRIETPDGPILTRGATTKEVVESRETLTDDEGEPTGEKVTMTEKLVTKVAVTHPDGRIEVLSTAQEVGDFITRYAERLCDALLARNVPQYDFKPLPSEWALTRPIAVAMPPLPGRAERGLFDIQAHFAIAAARVMRKHNAVIINAEMGTGKTITSVASLELLNQWPALVMCPGHMTDKWRRELEIGSNQSDPIVARILDTGAKPAVDVTAKIRNVDGRILQDTREGARRELRVECPADRVKTVMNYCADNWLDPTMECDKKTQQAIERASAQRKRQDDDDSPGDGVFVTWTLNVLDTNSGSHFFNVVQPMIENMGGEIVENRRVQRESELDAKTGKVTQSGRRRVLTIRMGATQCGRLLAEFDRLRLRAHVIMQSADTITVEIADRDLYTLFDFVRDYESGHLGRKAVAIVSYDAAKYDAGFRNLSSTFARRVWDEDGGEWVTRNVRVCPGCGQAVEDESLEAGCCKHTLTRPVFDESGKRVRDEQGQGSPSGGNLVEKEYVCGTPLSEMSRWRRVGVSRLVRDKFAHWFKVYIVDEVHEAQAGDTDIGAADGRFISGIKRSIALTGTLFGGCASSLFYLLFRRVAEVRDLYSYRDVGRWIQHYGAVKTTWTERFDEQAVGRGLSTGIQRWNMHVKELPRVHPGIIRHLLPQTLFAKITDLGYALPPLYEEIIRVKMGDKLEKHYRDTDERLLEYARHQRAANKDNRWFSIWWNTILRRPNSAFRDEVATLKGEEGFDLDAIVNGDDPHDLLPKEAKLVELVNRNMTGGRRTLLFVEQTATRDIRKRLKAVLEANVKGVRVGILSASLEAAKREAWIRHHTPSLDVLLVNPRLVKTGLDLVMFSDIIFAELTYSLTTLWQAMRRVWRTGQANPVTTTFLVYAGAAEDAGLNWMGQKMKAGMILYGDSAAGALIDETEEEEEDLRREMIRQALQGKSYEALGDVVNLFTDPNQRVGVAVTTSPTGSPTATSPRLTVFDLLLAQARGEIQVEGRALRKSRVVQVSELQLGMF